MVVLVLPDKYLPSVLVRLQQHQDQLLPGIETLSSLEAQEGEGPWSGCSELKISSITPSTNPSFYIRVIKIRKGFTIYLI